PAALLLLSLAQGPRAVQVGPITALAWPAQLNLAEGLAREAARPADWPGFGRLAPDSLTLIAVPDRARLDPPAHARAPTWGVAPAGRGEGGRGAGGWGSGLLRRF